MFVNVKKGELFTSRVLSRQLFQAWADRNTPDAFAHDNHMSACSHKSHNQPQSSYRMFYIETWAF
jgi:hypothetical protein